MVGSSVERTPGQTCVQHQRMKTSSHPTNQSLASFGTFSPALHKMDLHHRRATRPHRVSPWVCVCLTGVATLMWTFVVNEDKSVCLVLQLRSRRLSLSRERVTRRLRPGGRGAAGATPKPSPVNLKTVNTPLHTSEWELVTPIGQTSYCSSQQAPHRTFKSKVETELSSFQTETFSVCVCVCVCSQAGDRRLLWSCWSQREFTSLTCLCCWRPTSPSTGQTPWCPRTNGQFKTRTWYWATEPLCHLLGWSLCIILINVLEARELRKAWFYMFLSYL